MMWLYPWKHNNFIPIFLVHLSVSSSQILIILIPVFWLLKQEVELQRLHSWVCIYSGCQIWKNKTFNYRECKKDIQHPAKHNPLKPQLEPLTCAHTKLSTAKAPWAVYYKSSTAWTKKPVLWGIIQLSNQKIPQLLITLQFPSSK